MVRSGAIALVLVLVGAACADDILKERPTTQREAAAKPFFSTSTTSAPGASTVCAAYRRQLRTVRLALRFPSRPDYEALRNRELSLQALIADACE